VDPSSGEVTEVVKSDVPDLIFITGSIQDSESVVKGASISIRYRRGQAFKGQPALLWTINGEKGEIRLSSYNGPAINANSEDVVIEVHDYQTDELQKVEWDWASYEEYPPMVKNIAALYDAFADGNVSSYADFEHAWKRHKQLDGILADFDAA
jgi:predicted dehydrogenase